MIRSLEDIDWKTAKTYVQKSTGKKVKAVEMRDDFEIRPADTSVTKKKIRGKVLDMEGKPVTRTHEIKIDEAASHKKDSGGHGGTLKGKKGDYVIRMEDGTICACARVDPKDELTAIFATKYTA